MHITLPSFEPSMNNDIIANVLYPSYDEVRSVTYVDFIADFCVRNSLYDCPLLVDYT